MNRALAAAARNIRNVAGHSNVNFVPSPINIIHQMKSQRYRKIVEKNKEFEKKSPYNFCDRWCERCTYEKQNHCRLYLDELERKMSCLAHGRDKDDQEVTREIMEEQYKGVDEVLEKAVDKFSLNFDDTKEFNEEEIDFEDLPKDIQEHIKFVENHPLTQTVERYRKCAHIFLKDSFYEKKNIPPNIRYHLETIGWYHTLLSAKLERALAGFHEQVCEDEFALYDAVAQFAICRKAIDESLRAFRKIKSIFHHKQKEIIELVALLNNIHSRIEVIEESI